MPRHVHHRPPGPPPGPGGPGALTAALTAALTGEPEPAPARPAARVATLLGEIEALAYALPAPTVPRGVVGQQPPAQGMTMPQLRATLLRQGTTVEVKDQAWRYLVTQARAQRGDWHLYTLGMLLPGLWKAALTLAPPRATPLGRVQAVHRLIAEETLFALHRIDATGPYLAKRLIDAAVYGTKVELGIRRRVRDQQPPTAGLEALTAAEAAGTAAQARLPWPARGHPYLVLARIVAATAGKPPGQRLTAQDARLIAHTYIDGYTLAQAARWEQLPEPTARMRRWRAAQLVAHELDHARPTDQQPAEPPGPAAGRRQET
ncbi:hypothetical protein KIF24_10960 [Micromonospora sp. Llam7]|uniref:hypothetical protein n=1 Tax=Micromonospora tarapacensis TaxID=2835305 RepID=UPI001C83090B|nr:hypothetical protein [Micromonospora tarapacensis]MBX7266499.1 hypothetical protein [Micromonospora tarapacensis]